MQTTEVLGKFACRVTSKILGIGSAERSWGDVKHIKTDKRAGMSAKKIEKSATIFGASCSQKSAVQQYLKEKDSMYKSSLSFDDEDCDIMVVDTSWLSFGCRVVLLGQPLLRVMLHCF